MQVTCLTQGHNELCAQSNQGPSSLRSDALYPLSHRAPIQLTTQQLMLLQQCAIKYSICNYVQEQLPPQICVICARVLVGQNLVALSCL